MVFTRVLWDLEFTEVSRITSCPCSWCESLPFLRPHPNTWWFGGQGGPTAAADTPFHHCPPQPLQSACISEAVGSVLVFLYQMFLHLLCHVTSKLSKALFCSSDQKLAVTFSFSKKGAQSPHFPVLASFLLLHPLLPQPVFHKIKLISCSVLHFHSGPGPFFPAFPKPDPLLRVQVKVFLLHSSGPDATDTFASWIPVALSVFTLSLRRVYRVCKCGICNCTVRVFQVRRYPP